MGISRFHLIPLLAMACFTEPEGTLGIWVVPSNVIAVAHPHDCAPHARTKIFTMQGNLCVLETPQEVRKRLEEATK